jgi:hypothetical protein
MIITYNNFPYRLDTKLKKQEGTAIFNAFIVNKDRG